MKAAPSQGHRCSTAQETTKDTKDTKEKVAGGRPETLGIRTMTIDQWLEAAQNDADGRRLPALKPLLETLARTTKALRAADFNERADGTDMPFGIRNSEFRIPERIPNS
jgi:hypothetical protein